MTSTTITTILLWLHFIGLAAGGAASFGIPIVGSKLPTSSPEMKPALFAIAKGLSNIGRAGLVVLLVTGPLMLWLRFGWTAPNFWFWVKMVLVVLLLAAVIYAGILLDRSSKGDMDAGRQSPQVGMAAMLAFIAIIFSAAFAFN